MLLRFIVLLGYAIGSYFFQDYLRHHAPQPSEEFIYSGTRPGIALYHIFIPLLGPIMAFMWMDFSPLPLLFTLLLFIVLPVAFVLMPWLWRVKVLPLSLLAAAILGALTFLVLAASIWILLGGTLKTPPLLLVPLLISILAPPALMVFLLYLWAPEILPLSEQEQQAHHGEALQLLASFFTTYPKPSVFVVDGEAQHRIKGNPFLGSGPGLAVTEPENVIVLRSGFEIKGFIGPGTLFTDKAQVVYQVLDLQRQFRSTKVEALTRDGIRVQLPCGTAFQIDAGHSTPQLNEPWPYRSNAAYRALFSAEEVDPEGKTPLEAHEADSWKELPLQLATHRLQQVVAGYSLDELYSTKLADYETLNRLKIGKDVREFIAKALAEKGIQVLSGGVGNKIVPVDPEVTQQRVENWKANWIKKAMLNQSKAQVNHLEAMEKVRSKVLNELILSLIEQGQTLDDGGKKITATVITLRLLEKLEQMACDPHVRPLLLDSTLPYLNTLQQRTREGQGGAQ